MLATGLAGESTVMSSRKKNCKGAVDPTGPTIRHQTWGSNPRGGNSSAPHLSNPGPPPASSQLGTTREVLSRDHDRQLDPQPRSGAMKTIAKRHIGPDREWGSKVQGPRGIIMMVCSRVDALVQTRVVQEPGIQQRAVSHAEPLCTAAMR